MQDLAELDEKQEEEFAELLDAGAVDLKQRPSDSPDFVKANPLEDQEQRLAKIESERQEAQEEEEAEMAEEDNVIEGQHDDPHGVKDYFEANEEQEDEEEEEPKPQVAQDEESEEADGLDVDADDFDANLEYALAGQDQEELDD